MSGTLFVVATPIGNLEDITLRALRVLREVDLVAAENAQRAAVLLRHYGIHTPVTTYFEGNEARKAPQLVQRLRGGMRIALISEAGTPCISDPGYRLVRLAAESGVTVVPVPGPSAHCAALSVAGLPTDRFAFEGFLPRKATKRQRALEALREEERTLVFYESPHRLARSLQDMHRILGDRRAVLLREMTKLHEEAVRGTLGELAQRCTGVRGEITLVVAGCSG